MSVTNNLEFINGEIQVDNGNVGISWMDSRRVISSRTDAEFEMVTYSPGYVYIVKFKDPKDEMWFRLKYE